MATVDALLAALHERTDEYTPQQAARADSALLGWHRVARNAIRILTMVDPPPEVMPILQTVTRESELRDAHVDAPISAAGYTLGALADTLVSHPDVVAGAGHADRAQLRSCILNCLHAATTTLLAVPTQSTEPVWSLIRQLADATEPASYVPWKTLHGPLGDLALGPVRGSVDEAAARWAECATDVLTSRTRVTSYAFQRTAASISRLCQVASAVLRDHHEHQTETALTEAFQSWQIAADWPPEIRLGGRNTELRVRSQDLDDALTGDRFKAMDRPSQQDALRAALPLAEKVAARHETALTQLATGRGLWISAHALGPTYLTQHPGTHRTDWIPGSRAEDGERLTQAAHRAASKLREAVDQALGEHRSSVTTEREPHRVLWETVTVGPPASKNEDSELLQPVRAEEHHALAGSPVRADQEHAYIRTRPADGVVGLIARSEPGRVH